MPKRSMKQDDPLEDFTRREIALDGVTKIVYVAGAGPAVIVMTEMPGISPHVARFARWVRDAGFTVYMPSLFGRDGAVPSAEEGVAIFQRACVSKEFRALSANVSSPVTQWLRALARLAGAPDHGQADGVDDQQRGEDVERRLRLLGQFGREQERGEHPPGRYRMYRLSVAAT